VAAGDDMHAAVLHIRIVQRHPSAQQIGWLQDRPVGVILMPNRRTTVSWWLVLDLVMPNPNGVRAHQLGDGFRQAGMKEQLVKLSVGFPSVDDLDNDPTALIAVKFTVEQRLAF